MQLAGPTPNVIPKPIAEATAPPVPVDPPVKASMVDYASLDSLTGAKLLTKLGALTADGQVTHSYGHASDELFANIDDVTGQNGVLDAYTGTIHNRVRDRETAWPERLSVEHTWPRSKGAEETAEADLHHLRAADKEANGARSNFPLGEIEPGTATYTSKGGPWKARLGTDEQGSFIFEPPAEVKGDIARGMLYFAARYGTGQPGGGKVDVDGFLGELPTLLKWHKQDPVTKEERTRNDRVAAFQGNRNPFVDVPELAGRVGPSGFEDAMRGAKKR